MYTSYLLILDDVIFTREPDLLYNLGNNILFILYKVRGGL